VDNFPIDILKQLGTTAVKKERTFSIAYLPSVSFLSFYDAGELIRLPQGASKIRPIGKATAFCKIVDETQNKPHTGNYN
jgi:hypothetical protein